jgi:hypothetical protein
MGIEFYKYGFISYNYHIFKDKISIKKFMEEVFLSSEHMGIFVGTSIIHFYN